MKVFSKTHAITVAVMALAFAPKDSAGKPLPKTNLVQAPPGTLLDLEDDQANNLIREGLAEEYKEDDHGEAVEGKVAVPTFQRVASGEALPEGMTRPSVVRQDETENDGRKTAPVVDGVVVVGDTKENADRAKAAELAAKQAPIGAAALPAGTAPATATTSPDAAAAATTSAPAANAASVQQTGTTSTKQS